MVTSYNQKDVVEFSNYCQDLYRKGMKHVNEQVVKEDFENWKIGKSIESNYRKSMENMCHFFLMMSHRSKENNSEPHAACRIEIQGLTNGIPDTIYFDSKENKMCGWLRICSKGLSFKEFEIKLLD